MHALTHSHIRTSGGSARWGGSAIVEALIASVVPVVNSFLLLGLITFIYAVMAVHLFGESDEVFFGKLSRALVRARSPPHPPLLPPPRTSLTLSLSVSLSFTLFLLSHLTPLCVVIFLCVREFSPSPPRVLARSVVCQHFG